MQDSHTPKTFSHTLGATWTGTGVNFALYSKHAERVELCLFDPRTGVEERRELTHWTNSIFHDYFDDLLPRTTLYGYRVYGEYHPESGKLFNPNKLLLDPYAKAVTKELTLHRTHFCYDDVWGIDSAPYTPKCIVIDDSYNWDDHHFIRPDLSDTIIYELNVKGYTLDEKIFDERLRGKIMSLGSDKVIDHLKKLGITTIELLPIQGYASEKHLQDGNLNNFWGYNTIHFFAPHASYLNEPDVREVKSTIAKLHEAGIEVIMDVVYNHTAEGNRDGPMLSFKGIDNLSYYNLDPNNKTHYKNYTGCGNSLNFSEPIVVRLVMDSLRYWVEAMKIDGFRFDLASVLFRNPDDFNHKSALFYAIMQDPVLRKVKLIAEPWDIGYDGYRLGHFPQDWSEWNDFFKYTAKKIWRGDDTSLGDLRLILQGSPNIFGKSKKTPLASINYITSHDGFTLEDQVSYNHKHNWDNQENNRDGTDQNYSYNHGHEGPTQDPIILAQRLKSKKNLLATLLLSQGVPMLLAGDEFANSQSGNNNGYCLAPEIGMVEWKPDDELNHFTAQLIALRKIIFSSKNKLYQDFHKPLDDTDLVPMSFYDQHGNSLYQPDFINDNMLGVLWVTSLAKDIYKLFYGIFNDAFESAQFSFPNVSTTTPDWTLELSTDSESSSTSSPPQSVQIYSCQLDLLKKIPHERPPN